MLVRKVLKALFPRVKKIPARVPDTAAVARRVVQRLARGSSNLRQGRYLTRFEMDERKRVLALHEF